MIDGGWLDHHYIQLAYQLADSMSGLAYSFVMTVRATRLLRIAHQICPLTIAPQTIILWIMHFIPGLRLRASEEAEILGIDDAEMGEFAYDYVGIDLGNGGHDYHDDTHSHGALPATTGGREPRHHPAAHKAADASSEEGEVEKREAVAA